MALNVDNAKAIAAVQTFADATEQLTEIIGDEIGMDGVANLLAAFADIGNMQATEVALANQQAIGVEMAIEHLHCAISPTPDAITIVGVLNDFAKQLREGQHV